MTNCPNCGAIITGSMCEYCGTRFFDFTGVEAENEIDINSPFTYLKLPTGQTIKVYCGECTIKDVGLWSADSGRCADGKFRGTKICSKKRISIEFIEV